MIKRRLGRLITVIMAAAMLLSLGITGMAATSDVQATPNKATVLVNNAPVTFGAYTINGNNYFRLRDLAMAFMGSAKRFSLEWDGPSNAIRMISDGIYSPVGDELKASNNTAPVTAVASTSDVFYNGKQVFAKVYRIGSTNYFKLRDIAAALGFSTTYDTSATSIKIDTTKEYYASAVLEILSGATYKPYYTPDELAKQPSGTTAEGIIFYNQLDSGSINITEYSRTYFALTGISLSSDKDLAKLKNVIGVFVSNPDQVMDTVNKSKTEGQKTLELEGKSLVCSYYGSSINISFSW